jgi:hypothetical protein
MKENDEEKDDIRLERGGDGEQTEKRSLVVWD